MDFGKPIVSLVTFVPATSWLGDERCHNLLVLLSFGGYASLLIVYLNNLAFKDLCSG